VKIRLFNEPRRYSGLVGAFKEIVAAEGVFNGLLVRAVSASAPRGAAIAVGEVTAYDQAKSSLKQLSLFAKDPQTGKEPFALHVATSIITGFVATTVAAPFDCLKSVVMADDGSRYPGLPSALRGVVREGGVCALFRGWFPTYCRLAPHAILTFPLWEQMKQEVGHWQGQPTSPWQGAVCGSLAGSLSAAVTTPLDMVKTRQMLGQNSGGFATSMSQVYSEGAAPALFRGVGPRTFWMGLGGFVYLGAYEKFSSLYALL